MLQLSLSFFSPPAYAVEVMFSSCLCVCVCVSVCLSIWAITFEPADIETSFLVWCYILTISRSSLSIKVIGQGKGHLMENANFATWTSV